MNLPQWHEVLPPIIRYEDIRKLGIPRHIAQRIIELMKVETTKLPGQRGARLIDRDSFFEALEHLNGNVQRLPHQVKRTRRASV